MLLDYRLLLIFTFTTCVHSLNILCVFPFQGKSHFFIFKSVLQKLTDRGHNLTVISHFPESNPKKNYHDISLVGTVKIFEDEMPVENSYKTKLWAGLYLVSTGTDNCEAMISKKEVQDLVLNKQKFDVVLVEQFNSDCGLGLAYKLNAPVVGLTTNVLMPWHYKRLGVPNNPAYVPNHFLEGGSKPTLYQRIERVIFDTFFNLLYCAVSQRNNQNTLQKYLGDVPPLEELAQEIKFLLVYQNFVLTGSRLFPANVIEVGGYHVAPPKSLTGDLKNFVEDAEHGVIYISFGSVIKSSTLPADKLRAVLEAIAEFPQRFIWKWEDQTLKATKNLYISKWLPQVDILGHEKTLAFFSHSGMLGTTEAIHFGVPVVAMPNFGDQPANAASVEESGLGVQLQLNDLTKDNLVAALKKVLDPKFRDNVKQLSKAWHDRPMSPMDTVVFWTEFAARHPNSSFKSASTSVPLYQYLNLDVIAVFATVVVATTWLLVAFCCKFKTKPAIRGKTSNKSKNE